MRPVAGSIASTEPLALPRAFTATARTMASSSTETSSLVGLARVGTAAVRRECRVAAAAPAANADCTNSGDGASNAATANTASIVARLLLRAGCFVDIYSFPEPWWLPPRWAELQIVGKRRLERNPLHQRLCMGWAKNGTDQMDSFRTSMETARTGQMACPQLHRHSCLCAVLTIISGSQPIG